MKHYSHSSFCFSTYPFCTIDSVARTLILEWGRHYWGGSVYVQKFNKVPDNKQLPRKEELMDTMKQLKSPPGGQFSHFIVPKFGCFRKPIFHMEADVKSGSLTFKAQL
jgi:hypothetical protein